MAHKDNLVCKED